MNSLITLIIRNTRITRLLLVVLLASIVSISNASDTGNKDKKTDEKENKPKSVFLIIAKKEQLFDTNIYPAQLVTTAKSYLLAESQGIVEEIVKMPGESVRRDEVVIKLRHSDPSYSYRPLLVRSFLTGVVAQVLVEKGAAVTKGDKLGLVIDPDQIKILAEITAHDLKHISKGEKTEFSVNGSEQKMIARVLAISPLIDSATGTATVELVLEATDKFYSGTLGKVVFKANQREGIRMSEDVISYLGHKTYVKVIDGENKVHRAEVKLGARSGGLIEILSGVNEGDRVVERSSGYLAEGAQVVVDSDEKKK